MSTRGFTGFVVQGELKISYNHSDSYPSQLGVHVLEWLRRHLYVNPEGATVLHPEVAGMVARLRMVEQGEEPTPAQRTALSAFTSTRVSAGEDWYDILHDCQGDLNATLRSGYMIDSSDFPLESLHCEWGYLLDADASVLEVYRGGNKSRTPTAGRWAGTRNPERETCVRYDGSSYERENWQPVELIWAIPFADLPSDEAFLAGLEEREPAEVAF